MYIAGKAHIQHAIRLVQHQHLEPGGVDVTAPDVVEQAPRRGDHNIHAVLQRIGLRSHRDAAVDRHGLKRQMAPVCLGAL